jgi:hypothetical protein
MLDLEIDCLSLGLSGPSGCDHRAAPIARRAAEILAEQMERRWSQRAGMQVLGAVSAAPVALDLSGASDEEAAQRIARAWLDALALKLEV